MKSSSLFVSGLSLFLILVGIYLLTYTGFPVSNDENFLFDTTQGLVRRGEFRLTTLFDLRPQTSDSAPDGTPWPAAPQEPLQPILAAPLFAVAAHLPAIGLMHTVWLFNIFVTALTAVVIFTFAYHLGYSLSVSWSGALVYGIATIAWPYSRTFFREPLAALLLSIVIFCAWQIRQCITTKLSLRSYQYWLLALILSFIGAYLTKAQSLIFVPCIAIVLIPSVNVLFRDKRSLLKKLPVWVIIAIATFLLLLYASGRFGGRLESWPERVQLRLNAVDWQYVVQSVLGYQVSPGRSIWLFSPILLLMIGSTILSVKRRAWRLVNAGWLGIILFSVCYGILLEGEWWGGNGWGPRFFVPLMPLLILCVFPALEWLAQPKRSYLWRIVGGLLITLSIFVQILGITVNIDQYYQLLGSNNILAWNEGVWSWQWSPIAKHLELFSPQRLDIAWQQYANPAWLGGIAAIILVAMGVFVGQSALKSRTTKSAVLVCSATCVLLSTVISLYSLRNDPRYIDNWQDVMLLQEQLSQSLHPDDVVFLNNKNYQKAFMNYFKAPNLLITLPLESGERFNPEQPIPLNVDEPAKLLDLNTLYALNWAAQHHRRLWLVTHFGPFVEFAVRPTERYLVENYFPISEIEVTQLARAVLFSTVAAPQGSPTFPSKLYFADQLQLVGFDLPAGTVYHPGEIMPISLDWRTLRALSEDYHLSVQILDQAGIMVIQRDGLFQGTFGYTSRWTPKTDYRDNHGLQLPPNLAPGDYTLQVVVYTWQDGKRLPVISSDAQPLGDAALLTTIQVDQ